MEQENKRLHDLLSSDSQQLQTHIKDLEQLLKECQSDNDGNKPMDIIRKPVAPKPDITLRTPSTSEKSFKHQDSVSEGVYHISVNTTNNSKNSKRLNGLGSEPSNAYVGVKDKLILQNPTTTTKTSPLQNPLNTNNAIKPLQVKHYNGSLILNSVENFQIVPKPIKRLNEDEQQQQEKPNSQTKEGEKNQVPPLSAPKSKGQLSSTVISKSEQQVQANPVVNATSTNIRTARGSSSTSSSISPPLAFPPNQRKLPENVAPIPDNFEDLLQRSNNEALKSNNENLQLKEDIKDDENENKAMPLKSGNNNNNYDPSAHEIKDNIGEEDSNVQHDDDINNFFDTDNDRKDQNKNNNNNKDFNEDKDDDGGNDDDDGGLGADNEAGAILGGAAAGDIAVKRNQQQQLLDDNLKNEIAEDQGKEFGDGLRLEEGAVEEEDDG